jgi:hypothetical protein
MFRLTRVIVRLRLEPFGFSSIITYNFLFWRLLVGVKWWLASTKTSAPVFICLEDTLHNNFNMRKNSA